MEGFWANSRAIVENTMERWEKIEKALAASASSFENLKLGQSRRVAAEKSLKSY